MKGMRDAPGRAVVMLVVVSVLVVLLGHTVLAARQLQQEGGGVINQVRYVRGDTILSTVLL